MTDDNPLLGGPLDLPEDLTASNQPVHREPKGKKPWKKTLLIALAVLVFIGIVFGVWKLFFSSDKKIVTPAPSTTTTQKAVVKTDDISSASGTKTFENGFLGVTLTYPSTWSATESENQDDVRIESPEFTYATVDKGNTKGYFRIYIRKGARDTETKYIGKGVANSPSIKLIYTKPAPGQRTETYLTDFGIDDTENFGFFMIAGNFNLKKGDSLGPSYGTERDTYIIAGGYSAKALTDPLATNKVPVANYQQTNSYKQAVDILKSIQLK